MLCSFTEHRTFSFGKSIDAETNLHEDYHVNSDWYSENQTDANLEGFSVIDFNSQIPLPTLNKSKCI